MRRGDRYWDPVPIGREQGKGFQCQVWEEEYGGSREKKGGPCALGREGEKHRTKSVNKLPRPEDGGEKECYDPTRRGKKSIGSRGSNNGGVVLDERRKS